MASLRSEWRAEEKAAYEKAAFARLGHAFSGSDHAPYKYGRKTPRPVRSMTAMMAYNCISRWSGALGVCAIIAVIRPAHADPRAVVELFTSQGCSSCPPADKIIGELAKDPYVIALSMPIDYWDYLGWKDTLADSRFSARQKAYSHVRGDRNVYTPQVDRQRFGACDRQRSRRHRRRDHEYRQGRWRDVGAGDDDVVRQADQRFGRGRARRRAAAHGEVWICSVSKAVPISIGRGENRGQRSHLLQRGAQSAEGRRLERQLREAGPCRWKIFPAKASMPRSSMSRTAIATSRARCSARPTRRCARLHRRSRMLA